MATGGFLRRLWARLWLRGSQFSGRYGQLKALYAIEDPWDLGSAREQARFRHANTLIRQVSPQCGALLELGCGEGFQTRHLLEVADRVTGIELSPQAAERARQRCPTAEILVGKAEDAASLLAGRRFDVITAFEVLYYAQDVAAILAELQAMAPLVVVTNYTGLADRMGGYFDGPGWRRLDDLAVEDVVWRVDVWQAQDAGVT